MKKISIFVIVLTIIFSIFSIAAYAVPLEVEPNYYILMSGSDVAYPLYSSGQVNNYIGVIQVYGEREFYEFFDNEFMTPSIRFKATVENGEQINISYALYDGVEFGSYEPLYYGLGTDFAIIQGDYGAQYSYVLNITGGIENYMMQLNSNLFTYSKNSLPEGYKPYEYPDEPVETDPVETEPINPTPTLPPYTMPDDIINTTSDAFGNFIVGIGGVTLDGYEALFFKEGTLTNIGTCFLVIIGICFACFILTWIFKRGKNE